MTNSKYSGHGNRASVSGLKQRSQRSIEDKNGVVVNVPFKSTFEPTDRWWLNSLSPETRARLLEKGGPR